MHISAPRLPIPKTWESAVHCPQAASSACSEGARQRPSCNPYPRKRHRRLTRRHRPMPAGATRRTISRPVTSAVGGLKMSPGPTLGAASSISAMASRMASWSSGTSVPVNFSTRLANLVMSWRSYKAGEATSRNLFRLIGHSYRDTAEPKGLLGYS
jgi:hypothetical protein